MGTAHARGIRNVIRTAHAHIHIHVHVHVHSTCMYVRIYPRDKHLPDIYRIPDIDPDIRTADLLSDDPAPLA